MPSSLTDFGSPLQALPTFFQESRGLVCCVIRGLLLFFVVRLLSRVRLFAAPWTAAHQASLSFTIFLSLLKLMSFELLMPSNHLILCRPLLLPSVFPSTRVFSSESVLHIRWPKDWSFSISPSSDYSGFISFRMDQAS